MATSENDPIRGERTLNRGIPEVNHMDGTCYACPFKLILSCYGSQLIIWELIYYLIKLINQLYINKIYISCLKLLRRDHSVSKTLRYHIIECKGCNPMHKVNPVPSEHRIVMQNYYTMLSYLFFFPSLIWESRMSIIPLLLPP